MYEIVRRHLGKVVAGAAIAVTGTAVMVGITLPGTAGAEDTSRGRTGASVPSAPSQSADAPGSATAPEPATLAVAPPEGTKGVGTDPLTDDELKRAEALALTPPAASAQRDVEGGRGPQHLATELADPLPEEADEPGAPRRAEVRFYDYESDALITRTVNLETGKVEKAAVQRGVQPSAHPEELREALELILASPLGKGVKEDYKDATGKELTSTGQLWFNGDVYRTYREANVPAPLAKCGEHRCVRLVTKVVNGSWIDTRNLIVDLSARTVTRVG
ncbi:Tat pathway signal sequence domain protein [Streptomyces vilmorinianum]|uniref:Tat pathway signal sequence domain protein n=1 Tax=Streptomyces vilmorinianum TaxID=3051092 RepID=UPI0010FB3E64|nr:Tat pathway signal sequence domain protein [Streptomyces vilmorinianum]